MRGRTARRLLDVYDTACAIDRLVIKEYEDTALRMQAHGLRANVRAVLAELLADPGEKSEETEDVHDTDD